MFEGIKKWFAEERRKRKEVEARVRPMMEELKREQKREQGRRKAGKMDEHRD